MFSVFSQWRKEEKVDAILEEPVPNFDIIKKYYPHFYFKEAKNGKYFSCMIILKVWSSLVVMHVSAYLEEMFLGC